MATFHFKQTTTASRDQFIAALTDFGPGRSKLFGNSSDDYLQVYDQGPGHADVKEGSAGVWERLSYDWSDPDRVVLSTTDSNAWADAASHTYTFKHNADGTTVIDYVVIRDPRNLRGRVLELVLRTVGRGKLEKAFANFVKAVEDRAGATTTSRLGAS
jgi:hypothetical protein